jgi:hypothetical protein
MRLAAFERRASGNRVPRWVGLSIVESDSQKARKFSKRPGSGDGTVSMEGYPGRFVDVALAH